jgi:DNA polymerase iota
MAGSEDVIFTQNSSEEPAEWDVEDDEDESREICYECGATMPPFAMAAHERFHRLET